MASGAAADTGATSLRADAVYQAILARAKAASTPPVTVGAGNHPRGYIMIAAATDGPTSARAPSTKRKAVTQDNGKAKANAVKKLRGSPVDMDDLVHFLLQEQEFTGRYQPQRVTVMDIVRYGAMHAGVHLPVFVYNELLDRLPRSKFEFKSDTAQRLFGAVSDAKKQLLKMGYRTADDWVKLFAMYSHVSSRADIAAIEDIKTIAAVAMVCRGAHGMPLFRIMRMDSVRKAVHFIKNKTNW